MRSREQLGLEQRGPSFRFFGAAGLAGRLRPRRRLGEAHPRAGRLPHTLVTIGEVQLRARLRGEALALGEFLARLLYAAFLDESAPLREECLGRGGLRRRQRRLRQRDEASGEERDREAANVEHAVESILAISVAGVVGGMQGRLAFHTASRHQLMHDAELGATRFEGDAERERITILIRGDRTSRDVRALTEPLLQQPIGGIVGANRHAAAAKPTERGEEVLEAPASCEHTIAKQPTLLRVILEPRGEERGGEEELDRASAGG